MRKFLLVLMIMTLVAMFVACKPKPSSAITWCFGPADCKGKASATVNAMGEPEVYPDLAIMPTYTVGLNAIWLLEQKGFYSGPHLNVAKLYNLASIQGQYAMQIIGDETTESDAPNFYGLNAVVTVADLITKLGGNPGEFLLTFNPALGYTVGVKTNGAGFDHGPVVNVVNADLYKLCRLIGLCKG